MGYGYDHAVRRRGHRTGREKGLRIYIPAEELEAAGYGSEDRIYYRVRGRAGKSGSLHLQLYREPLN